MNISEAIKIALQSLWANKLRSVLTLLGVVIGVAAVIAVVTFVNGINFYVAERIFNLHRALTIRDMGTKEMRAQHDLVPPWVFDYPADKAPFTPGHYKMDPADIEKAKDMFYAELGWDGATGSPTRVTYERLGLGYVADGLQKAGLL